VCPTKMAVHLSIMGKWFRKTKQVEYGYKNDFLVLIRNCHFNCMMWVSTRVARFFLVKYTTTENVYIPNDHKMYQRAIKRIKRLSNIPNGDKIHTPTFSIPRPSNINPNWYFWFENIPSGNPGLYGRILPKLSESKLTRSQN
jgi:hypothetical protein